MGPVSLGFTPLIPTHDVVT